MIKIIDAKTARKNANISDKYSKEFRRVMNEIRTLSNKGIYRLYLEKETLTHDEVHKLRRLGYIVINTDPNFLKINW